jgi:hypothetical protein
MIFWLHVISNARKEAGEHWSEIPAKYKAFLAAVLSEKSHAAELGRVMLASRLHFLFGSDKEWTIENIVPLLDWSIDSERALQAWHGYLAAGTWDDSLLRYVMPLYERVFPVLNSEFGRFRERFCEHLAGIAGFSSINPITHGWLIRFVRDTGPEERLMWASYVRQMLMGMNEPAKQNAWNSWIKPYWQKRLTGVPVPLDGAEVAQMVEWSPHLGPALPEAVDRILSSPIPIDNHSFIYREVAETDYPERYPEPVARLTLHLLRVDFGSSFDFDQVDTIVRRLATSKVDKPHLLKICEELARLGYLGASSLRTHIEGCQS